MKKILNISGMFLIAFSVICFKVIGAENALIGIIASFYTIILGVAFIGVSRLVSRVEYFERRLGKNMSTVDCPECGTRHDIEIPTCPGCKYEYMNRIT